MDGGRVVKKQEIVDMLKNTDYKNYKPCIRSKMNSLVTAAIK